MERLGIVIVVGLFLLILINISCGDTVRQEGYEDCYWETLNDTCGSGCQGQASDGYIKGRQKYLDGLDESQQAFASQSHYDDYDDEYNRGCREGRRDGRRDGERMLDDCFNRGVNLGETHPFLSPEELNQELKEIRDQVC